MSLILLNNKVIKIGTDDSRTVIAGTGTRGYGGDEGLPSIAKFDHPSGVAVGPNGKIYIADEVNSRIRCISKLFPGFELGDNDIIIASEDGTELYHFNSNGRHLKTVYALTGIIKYLFRV